MNTGFDGTRTTRCNVCQNSQTEELGQKFGEYSGVSFEIRHCQSCGFSFVANPLPDSGNIYSVSYYSGKGADPLVDYIYELENPDSTIRIYEWEGILQVVKSLKPIGSSTNWLDFGSGNGGLIRFIQEREGCKIVGFEEGWIREKSVAAGIPVLDRNELEKIENAFDVVTAIE